MSPELTLVVGAVLAPNIRELLHSVDESSLPSERFELLLLVGDDPVDETWQRFASRRPNVHLVSAQTPWMTSARGEYVLRLHAGQRLFPEALSRLLDFAVTHNLDVVAGREVAPGEVGHLLDDVPDLAGEATRALAGPVVLYRRDCLALDDPETAPVGEGLRVGGMASYPSTLHNARGLSAPIPVAVTVEPPLLSWEGSSVRLQLSGTVSGAGPDALRPVLFVRELQTGLSFVVPCTGGCQAGAGPAGASWSGNGVVDLRSAAAGRALSPGRWEIQVALVGHDSSSAPTPVPAAALPVALVDSLVVVPAGPELVLDVGPTYQRCPQLPNAAEARVSESAAGCRLDLGLPGWHVASDRPLPVTIALDRLRLPAQIKPSSGTATLTFFVSGLPGTTSLSLQLGREPLQPTGLAVVIQGDGAVIVQTRTSPGSVDTGTVSASATSRSASVSTSPIGKPKAASSAAPRPRTHQQAPASGPVARLRRALPRSWAPQVRRLSRVPLLRDTYRRLTASKRS